MDFVYPLHFLDQTKGNQITVHWLLHYDVCLDAQKLHDGLVRLLQIGDYKKLGGRLRKKGKGRLEIHVPRQYTVARPAFLYAHDDIDMRLADHKLAPSLGQHSNNVTMQPLSPDLRSFMVVKGTPTKFSGFVDRDVPMLSIRITTFNDATLIGMTWAHPLMDGLGARAMLQGWSLVVAGKENELPPVYGAHDDVLLEALHNHMKLGEHEDLGLEQRRLKGLGAVVLLLRIAFEFVRKSENEAKRVIIPKHAFERLKAKTLAEMKENAGETTFVSDYVVLTSWFAAIMASSGKKARPSTSAAPMNARFRLPEVRQDGVYIQNMVVPLYTFLPGEISRGSTGQIALEQQQQLKEQATSPQVLAFLTEMHHTYVTRKIEFLRLLFGDKRATYMGFNDLARMGVLQVADFQSAVLDFETDEKRQLRKGLPVRFTNLLHKDILVSFALITSKDEEGTYSVMASLKPKEMKRLEKELQQLALECET